MLTKSPHIKIILLKYPKGGAWYTELFNYRHGQKWC